MTERVFVLLPVHNRRAVTEKFIRCLAAQTFRDFHLVLIDDGSGDGTAEMVLAYLPGATVLRGRGDWWWAGSLQQGFGWLAASDARPDDLVLIINDDTTFEPGFLRAGVDALAGRTRTLLLAQLYDQDSRQFVEAGARVDWSRLSFVGVAEPAEVNCFSTRGLFLRWSDMREIGGFHKWLLPHYASDYEYTLRARRKGFALLSAPEVRVWLDQKTTGMRAVENASLGRFLRSTFSMRSTGNPLYWTSFILLACPWRYVPVNLYRTWRAFLSQALETL